MPLITIPTRTSANVNAAADVNDLMSNCAYTDGRVTTEAESTADIFAELMNGAHKGLTVKVNATHADHQLDVAWTTLWIEGMKTTSFTGTVDIAASGALGLDTGAEASSTWYYLWAICKEDGTTSVILSASSSSPTMPAGYTRKVCVSAVRNDGSSNFVGYVQQETTFTYTTPIALATVSAPATATYDCTASIPELVHHLFGAVYAYSNQTGLSGGIQADVYGYVNGVYVIEAFFSGYSSSASGIGLEGSPWDVDTYNRYLKVAWGAPWGYTTYAGTLTLYGFEFPLGPALK